MEPRAHVAKQKDGQESSKEASDNCRGSEDKDRKDIPDIRKRRTEDEEGSNKDTCGTEPEDEVPTRPTIPYSTTQQDTIVCEKVENKDISRLEMTKKAAV